MRSPTLLRLALALGTVILLIVGTAPADPPADATSAQRVRKPLKVFVLAGQSNMEGPAVADLAGKDYNDGKGTLVALLSDPSKAPLARHLRDAKGAWVTRNDVWVRYQPEGQPLKSGPLGLGFTPYGGQHHFGPELQFGHVMGDSLENEVLLIKTAWGGKSLFVDFRPPSAGGTTGPYYTLMIQQVRDALANLKRDFPGSTAEGCEIAGFVWYQGWNDGCDPKHAVPEYEQNLVHLIHDVRRDLGVADLPVVVGELTGPWVKAAGEWDALRKAQAAAAGRSEFAGTVTFVATHDFVRRPEDSPNPGHGHHEFGNAETYLLVGDAFGQAMRGLLAQRKAHASAADEALGLDGVRGREEEEGTTLRVTSIRRGSAEAGILREGDVIRGVRGKPFRGEAAREFVAAVAEARGPDGDRNLRLLHARDGEDRTLDFLVLPPPPDLTTGGRKSDTPDWNLGPTGAAGWIFGRDLDTSDARQILVTRVDAGSPADGVLAEGDVIVGVAGELFDGDARVAFGRAIGEAEAPERGGHLSLRRWRAGELRDVAIELRPSGSFARSAPFQCEKSTAIVEAGCRAIMRRGLTVRPHDLRPDNWSPDIPTAINALALLASGNPEYLPAVREFAHRVAPPDLDLDLQEGMFAWTWGYANLFAAEYYLATHDESVLPAIREYSMNIALGQSLVGTWGHGFRVPSTNGTLGGYGAINQAGLICWMSLALAQRCGISDPAIDHAVALSRTFFGFYVGKGSVPYGDHPPYWLHDDNGKSAAAAVAFDLLGDRAGASFFARMATAAYGEKELGHTGNYFGLLWGALGANRAGPEAAAAFLREQRWFYDLARRWDGSFFTNARDNYGWDMTGLFVLHYAMPLRTLAITGRGIGEGTGVAERLTGEALDAVIASGRRFAMRQVDEDCELMSTAELLRDLADWSPTRRYRAARAVSSRPPAVTLPALEAMLSSDDRNARYGACMALQIMEGRAAPLVDALARQLGEPDMWLRIRAAFALASIGTPALGAVPELLRRSIAVSPDDPRGMEAKYLSFALFRADFVDQVPNRPGLLASSIPASDRELAIPAIRRMLASDDGLATMSVRSIFRTLTPRELESLLPDIVSAATTTTPSGEMFAHEIRLEAMRFLAAHRIAAGVPVIMEYAATQDGWGNKTKEALPLLKEFGAEAAPVLPDLRRLAARWKSKEAETHEEGVTRSTVAADVIAALEGGG